MLETERLRLRPWQPADRAPFAALNADPEVMRWFPSTLDRSESDAQVDRFQAGIDERGWGFWAAELRESAECIGFVGLNVPAPELPCSPCVEIGWRLARPFWGRGLATEAAQRALAFGFETLALDEIVSFTTLGNERSQAVMQRLGMERDAETFEHPKLAQDSPLRTHCLYRLSAGSWRQTHAAP